MLTKQEIIDLIEELILDNNNNLISAEDLRTVLLSINDSELNLKDNNNLLGLSDYDTTKTYNVGTCVVYNNVIYQAIVQTTIGTFQIAEFEAIADFAGIDLSNYVLKQNAIELANNKLLNSLANDYNFFNITETSILLVNSTNGIFGSSETYPISGKAILEIFKRASDNETFYRYTNLSDFNSFFLKKKSDLAWSEIKNGQTYTSSNGIEKIGDTDFQIGGEFNVINLDGNQFNLYGTSIFFSSSIFAGSFDGISLEANNFLIGNDFVKYIKTNVDKIEINASEVDILTKTNVDGELTVSQKASYTSDPFLGGIADLDIPTFKQVKNSILTASVGADYVNGLQIIDESTAGITIGLGGSLTQNTTIVGNNFDFTVNNANVLNFDANVFNVNTSSGITLTSGNPTSITVNEGPMFLTTENAPIIVDSPYYILYNSTDGDVELYGAGYPLMVPHKLYVNDRIAEEVALKEDLIVKNPDSTPLVWTSSNNTASFQPLPVVLPTTSTNGLTSTESSSGILIELGGALTKNLTKITGDLDNSLQIGEYGSELSNFELHSQNLTLNQMYPLAWGGAAQTTTITPQGFRTINNTTQDKHTLINTNAYGVVLDYSTSKKIALQFTGYDGITPGCGESFTIQGVTFTEGVDFIGQGNTIGDRDNLFNILDWSTIPYFVSVESSDVSYPTIILNFLLSVTSSSAVNGLQIENKLQKKLVTINYEGVKIQSDENMFLASDISTIIKSNESTFTMSETGHIFKDENSIKSGIEYFDDYSTSYTDRSLVDKEFVNTNYIPYTGALNDVDLGSNKITATDVIVSGATASTIAYFDATKNIESLSTATYPNLTELSYVKGITSAIQTQIDNTNNSYVNKNGTTTTTAQIPFVLGINSTSDSIINGLTLGKGSGNVSTNTVFGWNSLITNTTGTHNVAFGVEALKFNTSGTANLAIGTTSLFLNTTGTYNVGIGWTSLGGNTTGNSNVGIGRYAGNGNETGSYNLCLGDNADVNFTNLTNAIAIGYNAKVNASNTIQLGNTSITNVKTQGTVTAGTVTYPNTHGTSNQVLTTSGSGTLTWTTITAGSGTVSSVSVVTANGVSGTVATATTTPAITLSLGAITPTSVNKVTITAPTTSATLTLVDGSSLITSGAFATTLTATATTDVTLPTSGTLATLAGTETLTNKRITPRTGTTTSNATPSINTDIVDFYSITAQTVAITGFTMSGTPTDGQKLWISITGTAARAITWGASFEASTIALPTTTVTTNRLDVGFIWNTATSKWRCVGTC